LGVFAVRLIAVKFRITLPILKGKENNN